MLQYAVILIFLALKRLFMLKAKKRTKKSTMIPIVLHTKLKIIAAKTGKGIEEVIRKTLEKEVEKQKNYL